MYIPKMFLLAVACLFVWWALSRVLNCQSSIGRKLASRGMLVGCRKRDNGGIWVCDLCSLYGGTADIIFGGAALVFAAIGVWQWLRN
jgi:hypothetical protein